MIQGARLIDYRNVPPTIGAVLSRKMATFRDLDEHLGMEDLYDILEVISIDDYNMSEIRRAQEAR